MLINERNATRLRISWFESCLDLVLRGYGCLNYQYESAYLVALSQNYGCGEMARKVSLIENVRR